MENSMAMRREEAINQLVENGISDELLKILSQEEDGIISTLDEAINLLEGLIKNNQPKEELQKRQREIYDKRMELAFQTTDRTIETSITME